MKATGIVRRMDDLGRVVIPKEIRRTLRMHEGSPLEIFLDNKGEMVLKKYSPIGELEEFAQEYADALYESTRHITCIADKDTIIAVAGASKKEYLNKPVEPVIIQAMEERKTIQVPREDNVSEIIAPIIAGGDPIGAVILMTNNPNGKMGDIEIKLVETAASFLAKQMEPKDKENMMQ